MLKGKRIALIGGDQRYKQVIHRLAKNNAELFVDGFSDIEFHLSNIYQCSVHKIDFRFIDGIVLPVLGMDEYGEIELSYPVGKAILTEKMIQSTPKHCTIYTGTATNYLKNVVRKSNRDLVILFERDDVAIANSIPTAEAIVQIAMENTDTTMHDSHVLVTGFGRIGMTIARVFYQLGAHVTVAARSHADFARIKEMRMNSVHIHNVSNVIGSTSICINTIPHIVLPKEILYKMGKETLIIDAASKPGGTDFETAEELGIQAIHALGLPCKVAPKIAGEIIGQTIATLIRGTH